MRGDFQQSNEFVTIENLDAAQSIAPWDRAYSPHLSYSQETSRWISKREWYHQYFLLRHDITRYSIESDGADIGYAYVSDVGHIGPFFVQDAHNTRPSLINFILYMKKTRKTLSLIIPESENARFYLTKSGFSVIESYVAFADSPIIDFAGYIPADPGIL
jgi:hypothetical protein